MERSRRFGKRRRRKPTPVLQRRKLTWHGFLLLPQQRPRQATMRLLPTVPETAAADDRSIFLNQQREWLRPTARAASHGILPLLWLSWNSSDVLSVRRWANPI